MTKQVGQSIFREDDRLSTQTHTSVFQHHLFLRTLKNILLHRVFRNEPINADMRLLTNAMSACHSLQVILWVPIALPDDLARAFHEVAR